MEDVTVWALGLTFGFGWLPFKIYHWVRPERVKRQDRVSERIGVPILVGLLILVWVYFGEEILSKQVGYQFFVGATIGVFVWGILMLAELSHPLPEPDMPDTSVITGQPAPEPKTPPRNYAVDGNNIALVNDGFSLEMVSTLTRALAEEGHNVHVFFDANIGYLAREAGYATRGDGPLSPSEISDLLSLPRSNITVVPGGTAADGWIIRWATHNNAFIVTNDRYRDHLTDFPDFDEKVDRVSLTLIDKQIWLSDRKQPISMNV